jgi:hypothetical protein
MLKARTFLTCTVLRRRQIMVAVTYGVSRVRAAKTLAKAAARARKPASGRSVVARLFDALAESRLQQAHREIMRHAHLLPYTLDERGNRLVKAGGKDMPFGGW